MSASGDAFMEGALFKMKKTLTGFKWKKKWVRTDGVKLFQWATEAKPTGRSKPKHVYLLENCAVREITANKPHSFCVHENSKNDMMVFAATNPKQLARWIAILCRGTTPLSPGLSQRQGPSQTIPEENSEPESEPPTEELNVERMGELMNMSKRDLATMYFEEYDINTKKSNKSKTAIDEKLFSDMMSYVGIQLTNSDLFFTLQSVKNEKESIYLKDFLTWLDQHPELANDDGNGGNDDDADADTGDYVTSRYNKMPKKALSFECDELLRLNHSGSTWLNILEPVHLAGVFDCQHIDLIKSSSVVTEMQNNVPFLSDVIKTWPFDDVPSDWNSCYQGMLHTVTKGPVEASKVGPEEYAQLFDLCAVQSHFVQAAIAGCTIIVDEYSLPTSLKSATLLSVTEEDNDELMADTAQETEEEIFHLNSLVFRLLGNSSTDKDQTPSVTRLQYITSSDEIVHKIAGNDMRSHEAVRKALVTISNDACHKGGTPFNANVLLTTIVDYCGFRLQVFSPLDLDEASTLLLGNATTENIFVNALSDADYSVIPALAKAMNLSLARKEMLTATETLNRRNPSAATKVTCETLSKDLQIHQCGDGEDLYLFNFNNFLPPDLPRPDSNDINTRHLRPEYVEKYDLSIDSQAVHTDNGSSNLLQERSRTRTMSGAVPMEAGGGGGRGRPSALGDNPLQNWVRAATHLHAKTVPQVTQQLDTLSVLPMDSFGFTSFLHSQGVNIRFLGKIYRISQAPHVKDLVLCEAISRCVKSLLNQTLRNIARKGRAETIIAEDRKRSKKGDFINHQTRILTSKTSAVIYFFNMVLGHGVETDSFWEGTLPKILLCKFDLEMPRRDKRSLIFFPQLIQSLEYHTNVYFARDKQFVLASSACPEPFTEDDLVTYDCNFKFNLNIAGIFHRCEAVAEAFLASSMLPQAIVAFKIRLSAQNIFMRGMAKPNKKVKHQVHVTTYKLALCYYLESKYDMARSLLASMLDNVRKDSSFLGRILTLLMCADFKSERVTQALQHYETARHTYLHSLGPRHPVLALLYSALADLYFGSKCFSHAKLCVYKALDFTQRTQGMKHVVNAGYYYKLGTIMLEEACYADAIEMFREAMDRYSHYATNGADFGHEMAECYHGLAIADAHLGNINKAIVHCKKSLAISTADDKYITAYAVSTIILLAEEHERKQDFQETINLYSDAWTIVQAYAKDFDLPKILVIIAARIFSTFINNQPMNFRMLFHTLGAECEAKNLPQKSLEKCFAFIAQELRTVAPAVYIEGVFKLLTDGAENVLSTHSRHMIGNQKSVFGVPCPEMKQSLNLDDEVTNDSHSVAGTLTSEPESDVPEDDPEDDEEGDEKGGKWKRGSIRLKSVGKKITLTPPQLDVQVLVILRMVLTLSTTNDREL